MTVLRGLMWAVALALLAWSTWVWPAVPDTVPIHFGANGEPDRWAERSVASWFGLPLLGLVLVSGLEALTLWARRNPSSPGINLPNKEAILALPPRQQAAVMDQVGALVYALGAACAFAFVLIQVGMWVTTHGGDGRGWVVAGGVAAVLGPLMALVWGLLRVSAEVRRQREAGG